MFCEKCGSKLTEGAKFCVNCGNNVVGSLNTAVKEVNTTVKEVNIDDKEIKLFVKPTYKFLYMGFRKLLPMVIIGILLIVLVCMGMPLNAVGIYGAFIVLIFIVECGQIVSEMLQYKYTEYNFYDTKAIYRDGFLNKMEKEVKYKNVREVVLRQSFFQRLFKLGTIILYTNAESFTAGIQILNIENPEEIYKKIKEIARL